MSVFDRAVEYAKKPGWSAKWRAMKWLLKKPTLEYSPFPLQAKIEITRRCNLRCAMCKIPMLDTYPDMSEENFRIVLDKLKDLVVFQPHGFGEPVLHPQFQRFMEIVTEKNMLLYLVTNGTLLTEWKIRELLKKCKPLKISYSIDAAETEAYEKIRVGASFAQTMKNLESAIALKKSLGLQTHIGWYCTIGSYNFDQAAKVMYLANKIGVDSINFIDLDTHGYGLAKTSYALRLAKDKKDRLAVFAELKRQSKIPIYYVIEKQDRCRLPWMQINVFADGKVYPCCVIMNSYELGNIFEQPLDEIWNGETMKDFRLRFFDDPVKECRECVMYR